MRSPRAALVLSGVVLLRSCSAFGQSAPHATGITFREVRRIAAAEARQGVAVDAKFLYAIGNREIGKYDKQSGKKVETWRDADPGPIIHLNSGVVIEGRLYCAHSNYPAVPMTSSIEIFATEPLRHLATHSFGIAGGSATWVDRHDGRWWVGFGHYGGKGGEPGKDASWTAVVSFDDEWRRQSGYVFPTDVVSRFGSYSNSGGSWDAAGLLYATGHDATELYVLRLPDAGSVLELVRVVPVPFAGQGIAWDRDQPGTLYGIVKERSEVVETRAVEVGDQATPPGP